MTVDIEENGGGGRNEFIILSHQSHLLYLL